jgi:NADPH-dependent glutamate synthase beta subunit-like oxidoreductase
MEKVRFAKPWRGKHTSPDDKTVLVWAVGKTPEDCIEAFCKARRMKCEHVPLKSGDPMLETSEEYQWGRRFRMADVGMKAAGIFVPGGVIMTWWK